MSEYELAYGREHLRFHLPPELTVEELRGRPMPALPDVAAALRAALADPVGRPPLSRLATGRKSALIVVADHTRNNAYDAWLPELFNQLNAVGIADKALALYVASGTHRASTAEEMRLRLGAEVVARAGQILNHDCDAPSLVKVGRTDAGTIVYVDERVYKAELLILTGGIQYHYFAGYTGGRKAILPGVAGRSSIRANHRRAYDARRHEFATSVRPGVLVGNPVSDDMHDAANLLKPDLCVNVVLNADKQVAWLGAGDVSYVLRIGAQFLDAHNRLALPRKYPLAVIGAGGYPKDLNLFQAHKSLRHVSGVVEDGGRIVWAARCPEGEGQPTLTQLRPLSMDELHAALAREFNLGSACSFSLKSLSQRLQIHLISELDAEIVAGWGLTAHATLDSALAAALAGLPAGSACLVAPDMSNLLPEFVPAPVARELPAAPASRGGTQ